MQTAFGLEFDPCPLYLQGLSQKDQRTLMLTDGEFRPITWGQLRKIKNNNVTERGLLQRRPSELRKYLEYSYRIRIRYGSIRNFMLFERLKWGEAFAPRETTFSERRNWTILWNDWPYGVENNVAHLVVWTKFFLKQDPVTGKLTPEVREMVNQFVDDTFGKFVGRENVLWFKNMKQISSVPDIEHFHVMLNKPDPSYIRTVTEGDIPVQMRGLSF